MKDLGRGPGGLDDADLIGDRARRLNAKWTLDALLGVGGMGSVYAATHRNGNRAAIKILHADLARYPEIRERFLREGRIANAVQHTARVAILDDDESDDGEVFLVMELLEGETLAERLRRERRLEVGAALAIFDAVLSLLIKCHASQILHRDLKPENIFLTREGEVKVLDFGVARLREKRAAATREGTALGTPSFMSPEQARGRHDDMDGRADVFSVGACLYTTLTSEYLHSGRGSAESLILAGTKAAPSLALRRPDLAQDLVSLVDRALAFDRDDRFPDAAAMQAVLQHVRASRKSFAPPAASPRAMSEVLSSAPPAPILRREPTPLPPAPVAAPPPLARPAPPPRIATPEPARRATDDSSYRFIAPRTPRKRKDPPAAPAPAPARNPTAYAEPPRAPETQRPGALAATAATQPALPAQPSGRGRTLLYDGRPAAPREDPPRRPSSATAIYPGRAAPEPDDHKKR